MKNKKRLIELPWMLIIFMLVVSPFSIVLAAGWSISALEGYELPSASIGDIIKTIANWLVGIFGIIGIIGFMISGIMYLISTGNDEMITKAKNYMQYSIIGVIVGLSGYVLIQAIDALFNAKSF